MHYALQWLTWCSQAKSTAVPVVSSCLLRTVYYGVLCRCTLFRCSFIYRILCESR